MAGGTLKLRTMEGIARPALYASADTMESDVVPVITAAEAEAEANKPFWQE